MREFLAITKALADENRLRIIVALRDRELCSCQIVELLGLANSTVSRHMSILHQARIVESRKDGRWSFFRLTDANECPKAAEATAWVLDSLDSDERTQADAMRLQQILELDPEVLCRQQSDCKC